MRWLPLIAVLAGCAPAANITVLNNTADELKISGAGDPFTLPPGEQRRVTDVDSAVRLVARSTSSNAIHRDRIPLPPPGGEAVWAIGGKACFIEGDFTEYYANPIDIPARAIVLGLLKANEQVYVSTGPISAGPGERLPRTRRGRPVRALVRVPCAATRNEMLASSWLELSLTDLQPEGVEPPPAPDPAPPDPAPPDPAPPATPAATP